MAIELTVSAESTMKEEQIPAEYEAHVFLGVFKFGDDPNIVSNIVGFEPTSAWIKGEQIKGRSRGIRNHSRWVFKSPLKVNSKVEEHLDALVSELQPHANGISAIVDRFSVSIWCAVYYRTATPSFHLSNELLDRIARLRLSLDVELYFLGENSGNPRVSG